MFLSPISKVAGIIFLVFIISAPQAYAQDIIVYWNSSSSANINLGTVFPDGNTYSWPGGSTGLQVQRVAPNPNNYANLYVRASGNFSDGQGNTIALSNFKYSNYGGAVTTPISFTTTNKLVRANWTRQQMEYLPVDLYLTVPISTVSGNYSVTIYHLIVDTYAIQPLSLNTADNGSNSSENITLNSTNGTLNDSNLTNQSNVSALTYICQYLSEFN